jgi:hypothetical protein
VFGILRGMDAFIDFLRTATVHEVRVGSDQAHVRAALGEPDDVSIIGPTIWKYGTTEITFRDEAVMLLAVVVEADAETVRKRLDEEGLPYKPHEELIHDAQQAFVIQSSGVTVTLDTERPRARAFAH